MSEKAKNKKINYSLYALRVSSDNINLALSFRFYRITAGYILVYTDKKAPKSAARIMDEDLKRLTNDDWQWLVNTGVAISCEFAEKHKEAMEKGQAKFQEEFLRELCVEREQLESAATNLSPKEA